MTVDLRIHVCMSCLNSPAMVIVKVSRYERNILEWKVKQQTNDKIIKRKLKHLHVQIRTDIYDLSEPIEGPISKLKRV